MSAAVKRKTTLARVPVKTPVQLALRTLRHNLGMSQQQFSQALGVTLVTICRWETQRPPRGYALAELARYARHIADDAEAADVFDKAFLEDPIARKRPSESSAESALSQIRANRVDVDMRKAYIEVLEALERAYALLIERLLHSDQGCELTVMARSHQELKWELEIEKKAYQKYQMLLDEAINRSHGRRSREAEKRAKEG